LRVLRIDDSANEWPDAMLQNYIFYIFTMYEFSHMG
jgi:hypothetical protein